jgi:hypothetical protein
MAPLSRSYTEGSKAIPYRPRRRRGFRPRHAPAIASCRSPERYAVDQTAGSFMPLDTGIHWEWRNPLNIIPALILLFAVAAIVGMLLS